MLNAFTALPSFIFNGDTAYDAELNFQRIYQLLMHPNIKQRTIQDSKKGKAKKVVDMMVEEGWRCGPNHYSDILRLIDEA